MTGRAFNVRVEFPAPHAGTQGTNALRIFFNCCTPPYNRGEILAFYDLPNGSGFSRASTECCPSWGLVDRGLLSLSGSPRPVRGALAMARRALSLCTPGMLLLGGSGRGSGAGGWRGGLSRRCIRSRDNV